MDLRDFVTGANRILDKSNKFEYNDYKFLTDKPTTQEWTRFIKELEKDEYSELRKNLIKVRDSKNKIILYSINNLSDINKYADKGLLRIEWLGTETIKKASPKLKSEHSALKKEWGLQVETRLERLENAVFNTIPGNQLTEAQLDKKIYQKNTSSEASISDRMENLRDILTVLTPFMVTDGKRIKVAEILSRMNNLEFVEGNDANNLALARLLIGVCESRSDVFNVYTNGGNPVESEIEVKDALNLCMLKLYPNKGWLYNTHVSGNGESIFTQSLANYVHKQFYDIEKDVLSALKDIPDDHINPWCVLAICYGAANPKWLFGQSSDKTIEIINSNLLKKNMEIVKSSEGIFYLRKVCNSAPI